jgi:hypothetical protein
MAVIVVLTNVAGLPIAIKLVRTKGYEFEGLLFLMSIVSSFLYHICETFTISIFIEELQWHRLDNIFIISSFSVYLLYLSGNIHHRFIVYSTQIVALISQEADPWNINYSVMPIVGYGVLGLGLRLYNMNKVKVVYDWGNLGRSLFFTTIGLYFFAKGLDEFDDYLRFNHGMWHMLAGISSWYGLQSTQVIMKTTK